MGFFNKSTSQNKMQKYTAMTTGVIVGVSAVRVNSIHLPLAEYQVNGVKYKLRVPYEIAKKLSQASTAKTQVVNVNFNFASLQVTNLQGTRVKILYNPNKPKDAIVVE